MISGLNVLVLVVLLNWVRPSESSGLKGNKTKEF